MAEPMKIRAVARDGVADVRVLIAHDMESGQRRDGSGQLIPAWHVTELTMALNGRLVMKAYWGPAVSKNPLVQFKVRGARLGDRIAVTWLDNRGDKRTDEAAVV